MNISGIGSKYAYLYNAKTGKLSTKDGSRDEFVEYFNGDLSDEESKALNGFDARKKAEMQDIFRIYRTMGNVFDGLHGDEYEISGEIVDAVTSKYRFNGTREFTAYGAIAYTSSELKSFHAEGPYKTSQSQPYDPLTNSISIAAGDVFDLGNDSRLAVRTDHIDIEGNGNGSVLDDCKKNALVRSIDAFLRFADQQWPAITINLIEGGNDLILDFLHKLDVDTSREFTVNGTKCEVRNGEIKEVGNKFVMPSAAQKKVMNRYEKWLYQPLSTGWHSRA